MHTHAIPSWCITETIVTAVQQSLSLTIAQVCVESKYGLSAWVPGCPDNRQVVSILDAQRLSRAVTNDGALHIKYKASSE